MEMKKGASPDRPFSFEKFHGATRIQAIREPANRNGGRRFKILSLFETSATLAGLFSATYAIMGHSDERITIAGGSEFRISGPISSTFSCLFSYISRLR
ncbi:hypothetical protein G6M78_24165 [Agrobacterium tumefaciens]|uniref:hypothetical protein n=1 Tax=Agrobacterium tumefaciens TaxID=358 RepID=UPI001574A446|nr:hypothetical protein [Agrobacterium tumefaciens]NTE58169.1 hypothetical protein [Agrobacterium tumefaciens]NTE70629.1 hypothetical protein [Agrobacterium tumefaciens]